MAHAGRGQLRYHAMELFETIHGTWFTAISSIRRCFYWTFGCFQLMPPSLFSLWFYPRCFPASALGAAYGAARVYFSRSDAFLCLAIMATGFGRCYAGRLCFISSGICLGIVVLLALALYFEKRSENSTRQYAWILGVWHRTRPFYVHHLGAGGPLRDSVFLFSKKKSRAAQAAFFIPVAVFDRFFCSCTSPSAGLDPGCGTAPRHEFHPQFMVVFSYVVRFFGGTKKYASAGLGGLFNPVLSAFFFLGLA